ncbi:MAG: hypothetical protein JWO60_647 [Frankiales bacterium]|nr:hypothetical protein [Frankiales bacterium]
MPFRAARVAAALSCVLALAGCGAGDLQFRNDERLTFAQPGERERVTLPLTVSWDMQDFEAVGLDGSSGRGKGVYAVFVDRAPMPVGKDVRWLARDDRSCLRDPRCPNPTYLAEQGVYLTTRPQVVVDRLPDAGDGVGDEQHYVNVVLLDGKGARIGESAWYRPFTTKRTET